MQIALVQREIRAAVRTAVVARTPGRTARRTTRNRGVPHDEPETLETWSGKCNNWWTESASTVQRSVFMEDWVFSIAPDLVKVAHIDDLAHPAVSIPLTGG